MPDAKHPRRLFVFACAWPQRFSLSLAASERFLTAPARLRRVRPVSKAQLAKLKGIFQGADVDGSGVVYCSEVLGMVGMLRSPFTDHVFQMVGESPHGWGTGV